jgi:hypothetical protein
VAKKVDPLIFRNFDDPERVKNNLGDLGHFTAIVTAKTNKIGCGTVKDPKLDYKVILSANLFFYAPPFVQIDLSLYFAFLMKSP